MYVKKEQLCITSFLGKTEYTPIKPGTLKIVSGNKVIAEDIKIHNENKEKGILKGKGINQASWVNYENGEIHISATFFLQIKEGITLQYEVENEQQQKKKARKIIQNSISIPVHQESEVISSVDGVEYEKKEE